MHVFTDVSESSILALSSSTCSRFLIVVGMSATSCPVYCFSQYSQTSSPLLYNFKICLLSCSLRGHLAVKYYRWFVIEWSIPCLTFLNIFW
jgi:predicted neutral ceramidase superfamily lipid hydrolase